MNTIQLDDVPQQNINISKEQIPQKNQNQLQYLNTDIQKDAINYIQQMKNTLLSNCSKKRLEQQPKQYTQQEIASEEKSLIQLEKSNAYQETLRAEKDILAIGGLDPNTDVQITNVYIEMNNGKKEFVHTVVTGLKNEQVIVCLHGLGGSSTVFYKIMKPLSEFFKVYYIDNLGIGLSSRPAFDIIEPTQVIDYHLNFIEAWRQKLNLNKFILMGHSYGGYLAGFYALKYPQYVQKLLLLSPAGLTEGKIDETTKFENQILSTSGFFKKWLYQKAKKTFLEGFSLAKLYTCIFFPTSLAMNRYFKKRLSLPANEVSAWKKYTKLSYSLGPSTDISFSRLFLFPSLNAIHPLQQYFIHYKLQIPVDFYYGTYDWMNDQGAKELVTSQAIECHMYRITDAGHQMIFENPINTANQLILRNYQFSKVKICEENYQQLEAKDLPNVKKPNQQVLQQIQKYSYTK